MKYLLALPMIAALAACADKGAHYRPVLDGAPTAAFQSDLAACQRLAENQKQFDQNTLRSTLIGGGTGALLGELDEEGTPLGGAIVGAIAGGTAGAVEARERREAIVVNCMSGRGRQVVG